jgi:citrate lyase acyl carrier protein
MEIKEVSIAGTLESSDILVRIEPKEEVGIEIELKSSVEKQFGRQIRKVINNTLETMGVKSARVIATDKGALDCVIKARVECATFRAAGVTQNFNWEVIG